MSVALIIAYYIAGMFVTYLLDIMLCWLEYSEYDFLTYLFGGEYNTLGDNKMNTFAILFWFIYIWLLIGGIISNLCRRRK